MDPRIKMVRGILTRSDGIRYKNREYDFPHVQSIRDLPYNEKGEGDQDFTLDIYWPEGHHDKLPVIVDIHGGGFVYGDKKLNQWTGSEMADRGYIVFVLNYPLIPKVTIPQQVRILHEAFRFIKGQENNYPMDLNRVYLKGDSAGGLLSILAIAAPHWDGEIEAEESLKFQGLALVHPMVDYQRKDFLSFIEKYGDSYGPRIKYPHRLIKHLPPTWIVSSRNDVAFNKEGRRLAGWMKRMGHRVKYHEFPYTLERPLIHIFMVTMNTLPESQGLYESMDRFLRSI